MYGETDRDTCRSEACLMWEGNPACFMQQILHSVATARVLCSKTHSSVKQNDSTRKISLCFGLSTEHASVLRMARGDRARPASCFIERSGDSSAVTTRTR